MALISSGLSAALSIALIIARHTNITLAIISSAMRCATSPRFVV